MNTLRDCSLLFIAVVVFLVQVALIIFSICLIWVFSRNPRIQSHVSRVKRILLLTLTLLLLLNSEISLLFIFEKALLNVSDDLKFLTNGIATVIGNLSTFLWPKTRASKNIENPFSLPIVLMDTVLWTDLLLTKFYNHRRNSRSVKISILAGFFTGFCGLSMVSFFLLPEYIVSIKILISVGNFLIGGAAILFTHEKFVEERKSRKPVYNELNEIGVFTAFSIGCRVLLEIVPQIMVNFINRRSFPLTWTCITVFFKLMDCLETPVMWWRLWEIKREIDRMYEGGELEDPEIFEMKLFKKNLKMPAISNTTVLTTISEEDEEEYEDESQQ